jgi:NADPH:quinone reductase
MMNNKKILFHKRPVGLPKSDCFQIVDTPVALPEKGEILLQTLYVSVDPYLRGRMSERKSYTSGFIPGEPMKSGIVAQVVESKNHEYKSGEHVTGLLEWSEYQVSRGEGLTKINEQEAPLSAWLGLLGMPGLTAYLGLMEIGRPQKGETLVISGAAGAVGSIAGQIGKIMGCHVTGIAGSHEKTEMLKNELNFDEVINYRNSNNIRKEISEACPSGVDIYFDNVGGEISDGVIMNISRFARIIICGAISQYNKEQLTTGPRLQSMLLIKSALMKGFLVNDYAAMFPEALGQLMHWYREGRLIMKETVTEGFENIPHAFIGLFEGANKGKMIVKI